MLRQIGQAAALLIVAAIVIAQGWNLLGQGQMPVASAQTGEDACTDGYALWAHSESSLSYLDWSGSGSTVQGKVRSHSALLLSGSDTVIGNTVEYASSFVDGGDNNQYPAPLQVAPSEMPVAFDVTAYQPGGSAAAAADQADRYHYVSGDLRIGDDDDEDGELRDGLYYVTGDVEISANDLNAQVTIVANGDIEIGGSEQELSAYSGGLVLFSAQSRSWGEPIKISGGDSSFRGLVYAPGGRIEVSGSGNQFHGGLFAHTLKLNGSTLTVTVDSDACSPDNGPTATPPPTSTPGPTPTATSTRPPGPVTNPIFLPSLLYRLANATGEPNDECSQAHPIAPGITHVFLAEDLHDWYTFVLPAPGDLTVRLGNFVPVEGQIAAFRGESCDGPLFLQNNGDDGLEKTLVLGSQPAGRYFLYVSNDGAPNSSDPYTLLIEVR